MLVAKLRLLSKLTVIALSLFMTVGYSTVQAISDENIQSIQSGTAYYEPGTSSSGSISSCSGSGSTTLSGKDNIQKAFNYFVSQGLTPAQSAAVVGNLMDESSVSPEEIQGGGDTPDPSTVTGALVGWGIAQWTPGAKVIGIAQSLNITGPIYELSTQLQIVWGEMNNVSPTGAVDMVKGLQQITDPSAGAKYFEAYFEEGVPGTNAGLGGLTVRQNDAEQVFTLYGGSSDSSGGSTSSSSCGSVDCTSSGAGAVTGNAAIACDVLQYDPISYCEGSGPIICPGLEAGHVPGATWH